MAVQIGCGLDIEPIRAMSGIQVFTQIDSQPQSEFGHIQRKEQERPWFSSRLIAKLEAIGFTLEAHDAALNHWTLRGPARQPPQIVHLWLSRAVPLIDMPNELEKQLNDARYWIAMGHLPHRSIRNILNPRQMYFVGNASTVYTEPEPHEIDFSKESFLGCQALANRTLYPMDQKRFFQWSHECIHNIVPS